MKITVDCVPARYGGIATYANGLLLGWSQLGNDDELLALVPVSGETAIHHKSTLTRTVRIHRPTQLSRPIAQTIEWRRAARAGSEILLSTIPAAPLTSLSIPIVIVVHDLRHQLKPEQFNRTTRLLRRISYNRAYSRAARIICISQRTRDDLLNLHPSISEDRVDVVHEGADHVRDWHCAPSNRSLALAFAHHTNKRPMMAVDAWIRLKQMGVDVPQLCIIGLKSGDAHAIRTYITSRNIQNDISISPYLPPRQFQELMTSCRLVIYPSDFEGFGLPALEAMALGKPVVVGPDPAIAEVSGGHAITMTEWSVDSLVDCVRSAMRTPATLGPALRHASTFTWRRTAAQTRNVLVRALEDCRSGEFTASGKRSC